MTISKTYLFKRANGIWYILYDVEGRRKWKSTKATRKSEASKYLDRFFENSIQKSSEKPPKEQPKLIKLSSFVEEFLTFARVNYARASVNIFNVCLRNLRIIVGDCPLAAIDARHVDQYKTQRLEKKSPVTVNVELRSLRTILNYAVRWQLIEANPFARVQLVRIPEMPPLFFTKEEFQLLLSVIKQAWFKDVIVFTVLTGMRRGEVANLHWNDVDLERKLIYIHSTSTFRSKWGKQRVIPLNDQVVDILKSKTIEDPSGFVFTFQGRKVKEGYLSQRFKDYVMAAGITKRLHFHSLRHSHATWLLQNSVSIYEVQKLLGHSSIETTQIYSHLQSEQLHATVNRLKLDF